MADQVHTQSVYLVTMPFRYTGVPAPRQSFSPSLLFVTSSSHSEKPACLTTYKTPLDLTPVNTLDTLRTDPTLVRTHSLCLRSSSPAAGRGDMAPPVCPSQVVHLAVPGPKVHFSVKRFLLQTTDQNPRRAFSRSLFAPILLAVLLSFTTSQRIKIPKLEGYRWEARQEQRQNLLKAKRKN